MLAFSNDYYELIFRATQSVELFCAYDLTQWDVRRIVNHMNSYARKNLEGATPYQLALKKYGPEILEALQIKFIPPDEVTMSPDLLKK